MKTLAFLPTTRDAHPGASPISTSLSAPGLTVLLARSGEAKARILSSFQQGLSPAMRPPHGSASGAEAFVIRAQDFGNGGESSGPELSSRLAGAGSPARSAVAALRVQAATLLDADHGGGHIAELTARLRELDARLVAALEAEGAERERIDPLLAAAAAIAELEHQRDRTRAEREHWLTLIRLWPEWEALQRVRGDVDRLARFGQIPADAEQRHASLRARCERAERTLRGLRREISALIAERDALRQGESLPSATAEAVARLCAELPAYRARLLELAATRARLADLERTLAAGLRRLGRDWDITRLEDIDLLSARRADLQRWQQRSHAVHTAHADAARGQAEAHERGQGLCRRINEQLALTPDDGEDVVDAQWRSLYKLRAQLEELWDVQSRAEASARAFTDREETLRKLGAARYRTPPRWLIGTLTVLAGAAIVVLSSGTWRGHVHGAVLVGVTTLLILVRVLLHVRSRWVGVLEQRRGVRSERTLRDLDGFGRRRDAAWSRAAKLEEAIRVHGARLQLADPVTPEALDTCEHELAARLRNDGARTELTALLRALLDTEEEEHQAAAQLAVADADRRELERDWLEWRTEAGLPADLAIDQSAGWMDALHQLTTARVSRDAARRELESIEPVTAAWETTARDVLEDAGGEVRPELCGSALTAELTALDTRVHQQTERSARREAVDAAVREAMDKMTAAETDLARAREGRKELLIALGVGDETSMQALLDGWRNWRNARDRADGLQQAIDDVVAPRADAEAIRAALTAGEPDRWHVERRRCDAQLERIGESIDAAAQERQAAERGLDAARAMSRVADLRLEREEVRAELAAAAREWKLRVLAAALLEGAEREHKRTARRELLQAASRTLATLTRGRYTGIDRSEAATDLTVVDRDGRRVPVGAELGAALLGQINISLLLGRAAQLASRGASLPFVLDDLLGPLPLDEALLVAQEIASLARAHPVLYVTTSARRSDILSAMPAGVTVFDVE